MLGSRLASASLLVGGLGLSQLAGVRASEAPTSRRVYQLMYLPTLLLAKHFFFGPVFYLSELSVKKWINY